MAEKMSSFNVVLPQQSSRRNNKITDAQDPENPTQHYDEQQQPRKNQKLEIFSWAVIAFNGIFHGANENPNVNRTKYSEEKVYTRLMDDLDAVEEKYTSKSKIIVSLEIVLFLAQVGCLTAAFIVPRIKHTTLLAVHMRHWIALSITLFSGLSMVRLLSFLVSCLVRWHPNWKINKYAVFFIYKTKRCADVTLWFGSVLLVWYVWFRPRLLKNYGKGNGSDNDELWEIMVHQITRLLIALDIGALLWLLKDILYFKLVADLHYNQLFDRIRLTVIHFHGLQMIDHVGVWKFLINNKINNKSTHVHDYKHHLTAPESKNIWLDIFYTKRKTVPIWILKRLSEEYLYNIVQGKAMQNKPDVFADDEEIMKNAEEMLKKIIVQQDRGKRWDVEEEDLSKYELSDEEKDLLFQQFCSDAQSNNCESEYGAEAKDGSCRKITRDQFLNWAVRALKHCWGLQGTLESSESIFIKLDRLLSTFLVIIIVLIWLLLSSIVDTAQLALLFSPFVAATFVFGDSCKNMFQGLIFTFAIHPFDVGDRVIIDGEQMKVNKLNILTSEFYKYDTQEMVIYANAQLTTKKIINLDITPDQGDKLEFPVPLSPPEDIQDLQICIKKYLDDHPMYTDSTKVLNTTISSIEITMAVHFKYLVSYLSAETKNVRKSHILTKVMQFIDQLKRHQRRNSSASKPAIVNFTVPTEATLEQISRIKRAIITRYVATHFKDCEEWSKVVMTGIENKKIQMALYLRRKKQNNTNECQLQDSGDNGNGNVNVNVNANANVNVDDTYVDYYEEEVEDIAQYTNNYSKEQIEIELQQQVRDIIITSQTPVQSNPPSSTHQPVENLQQLINMAINERISHSFE